jgi:hypothetical protein
VNRYHQYPPREWTTSLSRCSSDLSASDWETIHIPLKSLLIRNILFLFLCCSVC